MKTIEEIKQLLAVHKSELMQKYSIKKIGIFGSYTRGEQTEKSGIDIIVEFKKGYKTFDNYMDLKAFLEELFSIKVDLIIESAIKPNLKPYIFYLPYCR